MAEGGSVITESLVEPLSDLILGGSGAVDRALIGSTDGITAAVVVAARPYRRARLSTRCYCKDGLKT